MDEQARNLVQTVEHKGVSPGDDGAGDGAYTQRIQSLQPEYPFTEYSKYLPRVKHQQVMKKYTFDRKNQRYARSMMLTK